MWWRFSIVLTLAACGTVPKVKLPTRSYIDNRLLPMLDQFVADATAYDMAQALKSVDVLEFHDFTQENKDSGSYVLGRCYIIFDDYGNFHRSVKIQKGLSRTVFKTVVFHELGHCMLNYGHKDDGDKPLIMNTYVPSQEYVLENWDEMVRDLFIYIYPDFFEEN